MSPVIWICINLPIAVYYSIKLVEEGRKTPVTLWFIGYGFVAMLNYFAVAVQIGNLS